MYRVFTVFFSLVLLTASGLFAQVGGSGSIRGVVSDANSDLFLDGAIVEIPGTAYRTSSDRSGRYEINGVPVGTYTVTARFSGYDVASATVTVSADETARHNFILGAEVIELADFTVTAGQTGSSRALSRERAASNNVNIVASDAFGQLPDKTIADAIRRLPGINVEKDSQGREGRYVTIRGMNSDFNGVAVNGQKVMVSNFGGASRSVPLDVVQAENAESIEVTKSALPSQDAEGIGGSINIRTRSAFDSSDAFAYVKGSVGYNNLAGEYTGSYPHDGNPYEASAAYSNYLNEERTMGVSLSLNYSDRPYLFQSIENGPYAVLDGAYITTYGRLEEAFDNVEATGGTLRFDFRPSEDFELAISANYSNRDTNQGSQRLDTRYDPDFLVGADPVLRGDTWVEFTSDDRIWREVRDYYETQELLTLTVDGTNHFDDWELTYGVGYDSGKFDGSDDDTRAYFRTGFGDNVYVQGDDGFNPDYGTRAATREADDFSFRELRRGTRYIDDESVAGWVNLKKDIEVAGRPGYIKGGIKATNRDRDLDDRRNRYNNLYDADWTLEGVYIGDEMIYGSVLADYSVEQAINGESFGFMIDPVKVREAEAALLARGEADAGDPYWYLFRNVNRDARADKVYSYEASEDIYAGYLEWETRWEKVSLILGARVEYTDVSFDTYGGDFFESDPESPLYIRPLNEENDYTDVLPHLHLRYNATEKMVVRFSVNQTMARPSYRQLNPSEDIDPTANDDDGLVIKGDTQLDPVVSTNFDLLVDYDLQGGGRVSAGLFYKDMSDNVYRLSRPVLPGDPDYYPVDAEVQEFLNADGATVLGFELAIDQPLSVIADALHGFSVFANYTWVDSEVDGIQRADEDGDPYLENGQTPLFGQVPNTVNLGLRFERAGFNIRLAYNWSDAYLDFEGIEFDRNLDVYIDSRDRLDLSVRYSFLDHWEVFWQWSNVLGGDTKAYQGTTDRMFYREESDWTMFVGLGWNL